MMEKESNPPFSSVIRPSVGETIILAATSAVAGEDKKLKLRATMMIAEIIKKMSVLGLIMPRMRKLIISVDSSN